MNSLEKMSVNEKSWFGKHVLSIIMSKATINILQVAL